MPKLQIAGGWGTITLSTAPSFSTFAANAAANWTAFGFVPLTGGTVSKVRVWCNAINGTLGASDLVCAIYSSSNGSPNASLQSSSTVTTTPTGAAWVEFTSFSTALTAGTQYWLVLTNAAASPTTNYPTWAYLTSVISHGTGTDPANGQMLAFTSTNSGSTWTRNASVACPMVLDYGSSVTEGFTVQSYTASDLQVYGTREAGTLFQMPSDTSLRIIGVAVVVQKTSSPTGNARVRLYSGSGSTPTLVATTGTLAPGAINTTRAPKILYFSSVQTLAADGYYRLVLGTDGVDTSSNRYNVDTMTLSSTDTGLFVPYTTQPSSTLSTDGGVNFTDTANKIAMIWPIMDLADPFPTASSGGLMVHPGMVGGMRG